MAETARGEMMLDPKQQKFYALQEEFLVLSGENTNDISLNETDWDDHDNVNDQDILNALRMSGL